MHRDDATLTRINIVLGMRARDEQRSALSLLRPGCPTRDQRYAAVLNRLRARVLEPRLARLQADVARARGWAAYVGDPARTDRDERAIWRKIDEAFTKLCEAAALLTGEGLIDEVEVVAETDGADGITAIAA